MQSIAALFSLTFLALDRAGRAARMVLVTASVWASVRAAVMASLLAGSLLVGPDFGLHGEAAAASSNPLVVPAPDFGGGAIEDDAAVWHVLGLPPGRMLNMRSGPGARFRVIATLPDATPVDHLGCSERLGEYWCRVATLSAPRISGWVNGRYISDEYVAPRR